MCYLSIVYGNGDGVGTVVYVDGWGWRQLFVGKDGDGDNLETSRGDGDHSSGDGRDMGINICPRAAL